MMKSRNDITMKKPSICIISTKGLGSCGITNVIKNHVNVLRSKFNVTVVTAGRSDDDFQKYCKSLDVTLFQKERTIPKLFEYSYFLANCIDIAKYQKVHIHCSSATVLLEVLTLAKKIRANKLVVHSHNTKSKYPIIHSISKWLLNRFPVTKAACGVKAAEHLFKDVEDVHIIPNSLDFEKIMKVDLSCNPNVTRIYVVGAFTYQKNHHFLLDVLDMLARLDNFPNILEFHFFGEGPLRESFFLSIKQLSRIKIFNHGYSTEILEELGKGNVLLMPSLYEGFPVAAVEAQALGLRCVLSDLISSEICATDLVDQLPLISTVWANKISHLAGRPLTVSQRESYRLQMKKSEFNSVNLLSILEGIYND